ncbi:glycosyltransferase family 4 protein [Aerosakkonema funiforme]|uniref:Glycosyltransferase family 4 protein n=1 Tax=Aerosakkonema funiforme FACHB-1375 TaxID=2949571 RepID=A0A926VC73_9CYAN|nr:glycosyltransferase family 4 protein [Aerosakkonema funiforme]MBD2179894.1 glycosyltransferase family 4 protein [Aerosakkonema funiforme FACHB-1375]
MEKLRISIVSNLYPPQSIGGYERAIADYARLLHKRGHEVLVLTSNTEKYTIDYTPTHAEPLVKRCLILGGCWSDRGGFWFPPEQAEPINLENQKILIQELQAFQPQVCLAGNIDLLRIELLQILLTAGIPVIHYIMNASPGYPLEVYPYSPLYKYITCSNWILQNLQEQGYPVETAQTIYPGAAVEEFYQPQLPPHDRLRIAYASLVMYYKGADVLIEALCLLHTAGIPFTATIAGGTLEPHLVKALQELIASEGFQEQVSFPGVLSRQQLKQLYKTHNVLVFPSRFDEPFGISQIEAMAAGLTLVTSGTGGAREIVEDGEDGLIFQSENPLHLADILSSLPNFPTEWETITRRGQQKAMSQFSQVKTVEQLESVFWQMLSDR